MIEADCIKLLPKPSDYEKFIEIAAIYEYDAGLDSGVALKLALMDVLAEDLERYKERLIDEQAKRTKQVNGEATGDVEPSYIF